MIGRPSGVYPSGPLIVFEIRRVGEDGHAPLGRFQVLRDAAQVGAQEPARPAARHAVQRPGARVGLERAEKQSFAVLAHVERSLGIAEHGQLRRTGREPGDRLGEHVLVLERDDRQLEPERPAELARPHAGRDHHVAGADSAARGLEEPPRSSLVQEPVTAVLRRIRAPAAGSPASPFATVAGSIQPSVGRYAAAINPVGVEQRKQLGARSGETISNGTPTWSATPLT